VGPEKRAKRVAEVRRRRQKRKIELLGEFFLRLRGEKMIWGEQGWGYWPYMWGASVEDGVEVLRQMVEQGILTAEQTEPIERLLRECREIGRKQWWKEIEIPEAEREIDERVGKALEMLEKLVLKA